ncbi:hypothetical protein [Cryobacterium sp. TMT2-42-4]|uniref:hypothetical protein n=1 Tax=Cryobacterium sp. TMT2-42-4 TaxID=1259255 RepID=UPI00106DD238|nr:hypothetical protein [Cryobacterium sp. TMT2-42-4]TFC38612.1 hypothetical protein E3O18_03430 [Cryobacterium sp. TMT2-42-4]
MTTPVFRSRMAVWVLPLAPPKVVLEYEDQVSTVLPGKRAAAAGTSGKPIVAPQLPFDAVGVGAGGGAERERPITFSSAAVVHCPRLPGRTSDDHREHDGEKPGSGRVAAHAEYLVGYWGKVQAVSIEPQIHRQWEGVRECNSTNFDIPGTASRAVAQDVRNQFPDLSPKPSA